MTGMATLTDELFVTYVPKKERYNFDLNTRRKVSSANALIEYEGFERSRTLRDLVNLIQKFEHESLMQDEGITVTADPDSIEASVSFLKNLPADADLPRVSHDDEGDILMIWENNQQKLLLTIEGWRLHAVIKKINDDPVYVDSVPFDGKIIPRAIRENLTRN